MAHHDDPLTAVRAVREWLKDGGEPAGAELRFPFYGPVLLSSWFGQYRNDMAAIRARLGVEQEALPFGDLAFSIRVWLDANAKTA